MIDVFEATAEFVSHDSSSKKSNAGVSRAISKWMRKVGLKVEQIEYDDGVKKVNLVGKKGKGTGGLALMAHCDVVPAEDWVATPDPFKLTAKGSKVYGRGSADMKGSIACMLAAVERLPLSELKCPVYVVTTSDEEVGCFGAEAVQKRSRTLRQSKVRYGVIGEPTMLDVVYAHKGSSVIQVLSKGRSAHSSTGKGINANHKLIPFLNDMVQLGAKLQATKKWQHKDFTPPYVGWNIVMGDGGTASNITAPESHATINCRQMPGQDWSPIFKQVRQSAKKHGVQVNIHNNLSPLDTPIDSRVIREALAVTGKRKPKTAAYGTDGMVFGTEMELVVMGPGDIQQAHTNTEWMENDQFAQGINAFEAMIRRFCIEDPE